MRLGRKAGVLCLALVLAAAAGCYDTMWWDYRDDPYMADMARQGEQEVLRNANANSPVQRQIALRILAARAAEVRARGNDRKAGEYEEVILRRYRLEKDQQVRATVVRICAPAAGRGSTAMVKFLRERIAMGDLPGYAALSLAALCPRDVWRDVEPLTWHPAPEVRYQAALALAALRDPRGFPAVTRVWSGMATEEWPTRLEGMPLDTARDALRSRAERAFGRPLER